MASSGLHYGHEGRATGEAGIYWCCCCCYFCCYIYIAAACGHSAGREGIAARRPSLSKLNTHTHKTSFHNYLVIIIVTISNKSVSWAGGAAGAVGAAAAPSTAGSKSEYRVSRSNRTRIAQWATGRVGSTAAPSSAAAAARRGSSERVVQSEASLEASQLC